jgi:cell division septum initiation protein DivIVA
VHPSDDDFDRLGNAVARVLRETFATAADVRTQVRAEQADHAKGFTDELGRVLAEIRELPARAAADQDEARAAFQATLDEAKRSIDDMLAAATAEATAIRAQAMADATIIVEGAGAEIARAKELVAEERVKLDGELKDLVRNVHRAVANLEGSARHDHEALLDRATSEARMILRQARLHHRSTAREVDRMIEAAAAEAAALRKSALADAARVAARVRGVVDYPQTDAEDEPRPPAWVRPHRPAPEEAEAAEATPVVAAMAAPGETAMPHRRRLRPLAS